MKSVKEVNDDQKVILIPKIEKHFKDSLKGKRFAIWGLSFKPNTDDIREASSLYTIEKLLKLGADITVYDPEAMENVKELLKDRVTYASNHLEALEEASALIICTEWDVFKKTSLSEIKKKLKEPTIFDGRNIFDLSNVEEIGLNYYSIGR